MRVATLIMGVLGGVFGLLVAIVLLGIGDIASNFGAGNEAIYASLGAIACSVLGITGGALAGSRPGWSAILLLIAGVGVMIAISYFGLLSGILFLLGALFAGLEYRSVRSLDGAGPLTSRRGIVGDPPERSVALVGGKSVELPPDHVPRAAAFASQAAGSPAATSEPDTDRRSTPGPFCTACGHPFSDHASVFCSRCGERRFMIAK